MLGKQGEMPRLTEAAAEHDGRPVALRLVTLIGSDDRSAFIFILIYTFINIGTVKKNKKNMIPLKNWKICIAHREYSIS